MPVALIKQVSQMFQFYFLLKYDQQTSYATHVKKITVQ